MRGGAIAAVLAAALSLSAVAAPAAQASRPPVVLLVFDEFPVDTLVDHYGHIDARRYPGFAALARHSTWFENAQSVYDDTRQAVPAILDARLPAKGRKPTYTDHPHSAFTFFHRLGYRIHSMEDLMRICPPRLCPGRRDYAGGLENLFHRRRERLEDTERSIHRTRRPTFTFHHSLLPHGPWVYLPSGQVQQTQGKRTGLADVQSPAGFADPFLNEHSEQRHLLQVGFVDHEVGALVRRLERERIFDRSLVVVTADHGISFKRGTHDRRAVTPANINEIAPVPLFVKAPHQRRGRVSRTYARTVDVLPTIAHLMGRRLPWRADGRSAFSRTIRRRRGVTMVNRKFTAVIRVSGREMARRRRGPIARRAREFGTGSWDAVYRIGPHQQLLGRSALAVGVGAPEQGSASFDLPRDLGHVDPNGRRVPTRAAGAILGGSPGVRRDLALAVNGRIQAVGRSVYAEGNPQEYFTLVYPPSVLRRGANSLELYEVRGGDGPLRLVPLGGLGPG